MSLDSAKLNKKPTHRRRNDSGELDVFEAERYFSDERTTQVSVYTNGLISQRKSLDMPVQNPTPVHFQRVEKQRKEKKPKQPSSPGSKLAHFINSLFTQSTKKKSKSATQSIKDEQESPGWRRKRRSSISQSHNITNSGIKSIYSSTSSGFRTPPPYSSTMICKEINSFGDVKHVGSLPNCNWQPRSVNPCPKNMGLVEKKCMNMDWLDHKFRFNDGFFEDGNWNNRVLDKERVWADGLSQEKGRDQEMGDGGESDSSSDLFELQNYDLGVYSNGLPVYETTHLESIKRRAAIANGSS